MPHRGGREGEEQGEEKRGEEKERERNISKEKATSHENSYSFI